MSAVHSGTPVRPAIAETSPAAPADGSHVLLSVDPSDAGVRVHVTNGGTGGTASNVGATTPNLATPAGFKDPSNNLALAKVDSSGSLNVNIASGTISGGNAAASSTGSPIPASGDYTAVNVGGTLRGASGFDTDTSGTTHEYTQGIVLRKSGSGGSVEGGTLSNPLRTDPTGTTTQPVSGTVSVNALPVGSNIIGQVKLTDGTDIADVLNLTNSKPLTVAIVDGAGTQITSFGGGSGSNPAAGSTGSAVPSSADFQGIDVGGTLRGARGFDLDSGAGVEYVQGISLRKSGSGGSVELGTSSDPIRVDPTGGTTQPVSAASLPLPSGAATSAKQPALGTAGSSSTDVLSVQGIASGTALPVSAASLPLPAGASTSAKQPALGTAGTASTDVLTVQGIASMTALKVDGSAVMQPVSGSVTATIQSNASVNLSQIVGTAADVNSGTKSAGTLRVVLATDQPALSNKLLVTPDLPSGASTAAKQPALGTAGSASSDVLTVQGIAGGTAQPISAASLPLPSGASTEATLSALNTKVNTEITADYDTGAGVQTMKLVGIALPASGGSVAGGTSTNPIQVSLANTAANATAVKVDGSAVTQPVSLAGTQSTNVAQVAGTTTDTNSGVKSAGTLRVVLATDQPALTNKLLVTPDLPSGASTAAKQPALGTAGTASADVITVQGITSMTALKVDGSGVTQPVSGTVTATIAANQSVNLNQIAGTTADGNSGNKSAGTLRVVLATDQPSLTNKLLVTPDLPSGASTAAKQPALGTAGTASADVITVQGIASMTALKVDGSGVTQPVSISGNQAVNVAQINGVTPLMGSGVMGTGSQRVTIASDNDALTVKQATGTNLHMVVDSGTVTTVSTVTNLSQLGGTAVAMNTGTRSAGTQRVTIATDDVVPASQSGTWTVQPGNTANTTPWLISQVPTTAGGLSISRTLSAANTTGINAKNGAGQVYGWVITNVNAAARFVKLYNKASAPTVGTDTPVITLVIPGNATGSGMIAAEFTSGIAFGTGIGYGITAAVADNDTTAPAANEVIVNLFYK